MIWKASISSSVVSFNSQRDGILPYERKVPIAEEMVSIPNGMEFYRSKHQQQGHLSKVSIPNGMEFYHA